MTKWQRLSVGRGVMNGAALAPLRLLNSILIRWAMGMPMSPWRNLLLTIMPSVTTRFLMPRDVLILVLGVRTMEEAVFVALMWLRHRLLLDPELARSQTIFPLA